MTGLGKVYQRLSLPLLRRFMAMQLQPVGLHAGNDGIQKRIVSIDRNGNSLGLADCLFAQFCRLADRHIAGTFGKEDEADMAGTVIQYRFHRFRRF